MTGAKLNPSNKELQLRKNCIVFKFLLEVLGREVPESIQECAEDEEYEYLVECVDELAATLSQLDEHVYKSLILDNNTPEARELASWWEMHQIALGLRQDIRQTCL